LSKGFFRHPAHTFGASSLVRDCDSTYSLGLVRRSEFSKEDFPIWRIFDNLDWELWLDSGDLFFLGILFGSFLFQIRENKNEKMFALGCKQ